MKYGLNVYMISERFEEEPKIVNEVATIAQELGLNMTELLSHSQPLTDELEGFTA